MNVLQLLFAEYQEQLLKTTPQTSTEIINNQLLLLIGNQSLAEKFIDELIKILQSEAEEDADIKKYAIDVVPGLLRYACLLEKWDLLSYALQHSDGLSIKPSFKEIILQEGIVLQPTDPNLIKGIELLQALGVESLRYCVNAFNVSEYLAVLGDVVHTNPAVAKFIAILTEIQARRELALTWAISGNTTIDGQRFGLEGATRRLQIKIWQDFCHDVKTKLQGELERKIAASAGSQLSALDITTIVDRTFASIFAIDLMSATNVSEDASPDDIKLFNLGFGDIGIGHAIAIGSWNNTLCYVNRSGTLESGIQVFNLTQSQKDEVNALLGMEIDHIDFEMRMLSKLEKIYSLPMKQQKSGNCAWIAAKNTIWQALFFNTLKMIKEKDIPVEDPITLAAKIATVGYKLFSVQKRMMVIQNYLALDTGFEKDHALLAAILAKIKKPTWQERGFGIFLPQFNNKETLAQANIIEEHLTFLGRMPEADDLITAIENRDVERVTQYCAIPDAADIFDHNYAGRSPLATTIVLLGSSQYSEESRDYEQIIDALVSANITSYNEEERPLDLLNKFLKYSQLDPIRVAEIREHVEALQKQLYPSHPSY